MNVSKQPNSVSECLKNSWNSVWMNFRLFSVTPIQNSIALGHPKNINCSPILQPVISADGKFIFYLFYLFHSFQTISMRISLIKWLKWTTVAARPTLINQGFCPATWEIVQSKLEKIISFTGKFVAICWEMFDHKLNKVTLNFQLCSIPRGDSLPQMLWGSSRHRGNQ